MKGGGDNWLDSSSPAFFLSGRALWFPGHLVVMGLAQCSDPPYSSALFCLLFTEPRLRFQVPLVDVEVLERQDAVLECQVPLETIPTMWYLEDKRLQPSPKYLMEERGLLRRLIVRDARADDDGIYLCEMGGKGRSVGELSVHGEENLLKLFEYYKQYRKRREIKCQKTCTRKSYYLSREVFSVYDSHSNWIKLFCIFPQFLFE